MNKNKKKQITDIFTSEHYVGTITEVGLNKAKINLNANIKNGYTIASHSLVDTGRVNQFVIIYCNDTAILTRITYIEVNKNEHKFIEDKLNTKGKEELQATAHLHYLGEYDLLNEIKFSQGITKYPQVAHRVYSVTAEWLKTCFQYEENKENEYFNIGKINNLDNIDIKIHEEDLFIKHSAILGSTGSGKSNTLAKIIEEFIDKNKNDDKFTGKLILIDASGEYKNIADNNKEQVSFIEDNHIQPTKLDIFDWNTLLTPSSQVQEPCLTSAIKIFNDRKQQNDDILEKEYKERKAEYNKALIDISTKKPTSYETDSLNEHYKNDLSYTDMLSNCRTLSIILNEITSPLYYGNNRGGYYNLSDVQSLINRVKGIEEDKDMDWLFNDVDKNDIHTIIDDFIKPDNQKSVMIIDCSIFTHKYSSKEFFVNLISRYLLKEKKNQYKNIKNKDTKINPLILCIDEAHQFLNKSMRSNNENNDLNSVSIIAKEGRKFGIHLMIATQRPRDIPEDILSQINFIITHRITNESDINLIKSAISYSDEQIIKALPMLPQGHAFCFSVDFKIPIQIKITQAKKENQPKSESPTFRRN